MDIQKDETDDEFFGSQEEDFETDSSLPISCAKNEFGDLGEHEIHAKHNELKNVGFLDAYDEFKESRLQEGFEFGFLESFEAGKIIGKMIGEVGTLEKVDERQSENESSLSSNNFGKPRTQIRVTEIVHDFFTTKFQNGSDEINSNVPLLIYAFPILSLVVNSSSVMNTINSSLSSLKNPIWP